MTKAIIENGLSINVHSMVLSAKRSKGGLPIYHWAAWQWTHDSKPSASINYTIDQAVHDSARLELSYNASGEAVKYSMALTAHPCRFGGVRWFAICPHTARKVSKLHKPNGAKYFLARQAYRVCYRSQNLAKGLDRIYNRRDRYLAQKLKSDDLNWQRKPKGMRWKTFERHVEKLETLKELADDVFIRRFAFLVK